MKLKQKWLKPYIDFNTELRAEAKNFLENIGNTMNDILPGKFVEDLRKLRRLVNVRTAEECAKTQPHISYDRYEQNETEDIGGDPTTIYFITKQEIVNSKPIHIGFTICELKKLIIYKTY